MSRGVLIGADLVAVLLLVFGLYFPRNRRRDMVVALLGVNVAVMAIATTFSNVEVNLGLGLGLFGVLSIIRLRSSELGQQEIAYYFSSLAIGLLGGVQIEPAWVSPALMAAVLAEGISRIHNAPPKDFSQALHEKWQQQVLVCFYIVPGLALPLLCSGLLILPEKTALNLLMTL